MTPAQAHINVQLLSSAGVLPIKTVGAPGVQGAGVTGMQGIGVRTPDAAAVAAATVGFEGLLHIPNGMILTSGTLSVIVAVGGPPAMVQLVGKTLSALGAVPMLH